MTPIKWHTCNLVLNAPTNWDAERHGTCQALWVQQTEDPAFFSFWKPSWKDWFKVLLGYPVRLCILGTQHPPIWVDTDA